LVKHNRYTPEFIHHHDFFEVVYVLSGQCKHTIFHQEQLLNAGDLCLLSPAAEHSVYVGDDDSMVIDIIIRTSTLEQVFQNMLRENSIISDFFLSNIYLKNYSAYLLFHTSGDESVRDQILEMYAEKIQPDELSDTLVNSQLMAFFIKLVRRHKNDTEKAPTIKAASEQPTQILRLLFENFGTITLDDVAAQLHYSNAYCSKFIKDVTGYTFSKLLNDIRFRKAEDCLLNTGMSVHQISELVGYNNPENFIRAFKTRRGVSPSRFREMTG
jgi:YesN/AraC family two-component response regulator